jgi:hypothetical protein
MRRNLRSQNRCGSCGYTWSPRGHYVSRACPNCRSTQVSTSGFSLGCLIALLALPALCVVFTVLGVVFSGLAVVFNEVADAFTGANAPIYVIGALMLVAFGALLLVRRRDATKRAEALVRFEHERAKEYDQEQAQGEAERAKLLRAAETARREQQVSAEAERVRTRRQQLVTRFGKVAATKIEAKELWVGATKEMVVEALGQPEDASEKVFKTKTKSVFKYYRQGSRYGLKVKFEDDEVVGWEK